MPEHTRGNFRACRVDLASVRKSSWFDRGPRHTGRSKFSFGKLLSTSYDTFVAYSSLLPRLVSVVGLLFALIGFGLGIYSFINWLATSTVPGWTGLMVTLTIFFGVNFLILGAMTEYLLRIFLESTARPPYLIAYDTNIWVVRASPRVQGPAVTYPIATFVPSGSRATYKLYRAIRESRTSGLDGISVCGR